MIEVIYREDVSEESIHEPRNVKQIGSVDPKYRIYMEDTVLTCIRKITAVENEVHFGLLLGELKRAAGTTYLFIRGMVKATEKKDKADAGGKVADGGPEKTGIHGIGSGAVALERLTLDRKHGKEREERYLVSDSQNENVSEDGHPAMSRRDSTASEDGHFATGRQDNKASEDGYSATGRRDSTASKDGHPAMSRRDSTASEDGHPATGRRDSTASEDGHPATGRQNSLANEDVRPMSERRCEEEKENHSPAKNSVWREEKDETGSTPLIVLDGETWARLYEVMNRYFPDMEILGWYASFPFLNVSEFDLCREIHYTHFSGADKVLFLCDRIEREENFYRPDGAELRETEGYFTFFEKNDAMLAYQQENEQEFAQKEAPPTEEGRRNSIRQGTVGEAPRRKWNISAASVLVTAVLLAAVLVVNQYNSHMKAESTDSADGAVQQETSSVQALAVDGQVMDSASSGEGTGDGSATGEGAGDSGEAGSGSTGSGEAENGNTEGTGDGNMDGEGTGSGNTDVEENGSESADGEGAGNGSTDAEGSGSTAGEGAEDGNTSGEGSENADGKGAGNGSTDAEGSGSTDGEGAGDGNTDGEGTGSGNTGSGETAGTETEDGENGSGGSGTSNAGGNTVSANEGTSSGGENGSEEETVQTGSRVSARYYTVKNGETLYSICMDVYKTSAMVEIVRALNGIGEDYAIQEGQKILLP